MGWWWGVGVVHREQQQESCGQQTRGVCQYAAAAAVTQPAPKGAQSAGAPVLACVLTASLTPPPPLSSDPTRPPQDDRTIGSEEAVYIESLKKDLEGVLAGLSERDAGVLRMRFGLLDGREYTLDEVGAEFKVRGCRSVGVCVRV